jgi:hypothetical protein
MRTTNQSDGTQGPAERIPEARYSYYRRCQLFRRNGEQCKAPAEKGSHICYAHAGQQATAFRRDLERRIVLAEAVAEMRRRGRPECEMADLFMDFKGINVTLAVMARALINGRVDCKTAGQMVVHLQTMSKLLWRYHRGHRGTEREKALTTKDTKEHEGLPQICEDRCELGDKKEQPGLRVIQTALPSAFNRDIHAEDSRVTVEAKVRLFPSSRAGCRDGRCRDGPWQQPRAA